MSVRDYYKPEYMQDKKLSDLATDAGFMDDAITFLSSNRRGYTQDEIKEMSAEDIVAEVNEHFRVQASNEITVSKDLYFVNDDQVPENQKQAFARLMYAFDNAGKTEGLLDNGGQKFFDYAEGVATAPSTLGSVAAGFFSAGAGAAAVQSTKAVALEGLKSQAKKYIGRSLMAGAIDGSIAAATDVGLQYSRKSAGETIGEDKEVDWGRVGISGALGAGIGAAGYAIPAYTQNKAAMKLVGATEKGRQKVAAEIKQGLEAATKKISKGKTVKESADKMVEINKRVLRAIDPALVQEGKAIKYDIFGDSLPDGVVGGLDPTVMKRVGAAALELSEKLKVDFDAGQRITEKLAVAMRESGATTNAVLDDVTKKYGIDRRQLSAIYAAEVSDAARILRNQRDLVTNSGDKITKAESLKKLTDDMEDLYKRGMSSLAPDEIKALERAKFDIMTPTLRSLKNIETSRRLFMTSQPATTLRNNLFSVAMTGIDAVDNAVQGIFKAAKGDLKGSVATFKGSLDTFRYLTTDSYVAEGLTTLLKAEHPEKLKRIFFDAAISEAGTESSSKIVKLGVAANALNTMSDNVVKRGVIASTINRRLRSGAYPELGKDIFDMLERGTVKDLPQELLDEAMDEALAFTFQRTFRQGLKETPEHRMVGKAVQFIHDYGLTVAIPFPRYLASQAKFLSDYSGMTIARRVLRGTLPSERELAQAVTGAAIFGSMYTMQKDRIHDGDWWYERSEWGKNYDVQSALGPSALMQYMADLGARMSEGAPIKSQKEILADVGKILGTSEFRPSNFSGIDKIQKAIETDDITPLFDMMGDYFKSFTYPAAAVKDLYGQLDPRSSFIPDTSGAVQSMLETSIGDVSVSAFQRLFSQIPDFNVVKMTEATNEIFGTDMKPPVMTNLLQYFGVQNRTLFQMTDAMNQDPAYEAVRYDIFGDGPARLYNPIMKQATGIVQKPPKNALQREMAFLQIDPFKLYKPYLEKNSTITLMQQQILQGDLAAYMERAVLNDPAYKKLTNEQKRSSLQAVLKMAISESKSAAEDLLKGFAEKSTEHQGDYITYIKGEVKALNNTQRQNAENGWAEFRPDTYADMTFSEALDAIRDSKDLTDQEKDVVSTNVRQMYILFGRRYEKGFKRFTEQLIKE